MLSTMQQRVIRGTVAAFLIVVFGGCSTNRGAPSSSLRVRPLVRGEALKNLQSPSNFGQSLSTIEKLHKAQSRSGYDVASRARELGADTGAIFAFVRDQVRYEVYEGVLRGPRGTLMAMAGNAFDKSLLLGSLLSQHGNQVRYVKGRLPSEAAARLVSQMYESARGFKETPPSGVQPDPQLQAAAGDFATLVIARWFNHLDVIRTALDADKAKLAPNTPRQELLIQEATNHLWVEFERNGEWVALDPSFQDAEPGRTFGPPDATLAQIPQDEFQNVSIRLMVEERADGKLAVRPFLSHIATAASLNGAFAVFDHKVSGQLGSWSVRPILRIDDQTVTGDDLGLGSSTGQQVGERVGRRLGRRPGRTRETTAEWLEFEFTLPSGHKEVVRRDIFDRIGIARRTAGTLDADLPPLPEANGIPLALQGIYAFSFVSGRLHPGLLLDDMSDQFPRLRRAESFLSSVLQAGKQLDETQKETLAQVLSPLAPHLLSQSARMFHVHSQRGLVAVREALKTDALWLYEATPRLAIASVEAAADNAGNVKALVTIDLRRNALRVTSPELGPARFVAANLLRGALDGVLEHTLLEQSASSRVPAPLVSTVAVVEAALSSGIPRRVIAAAQDVRTLEVPEDVKARMALATETAVLVVPARTVAIGAEKRLGWWQVDVRSGDTLAVMDSGLHSTEKTAVESATVAAVLYVLLQQLVITVSVVSGLGFMLWLAYSVGEQAGRNRGVREAQEPYERRRQEQENRGDCAYLPASCEESRRYRGF